MTGSSPQGALLTLESLLEAEQLIEAYAAGKREFATLFERADRRTLAAVLAYTDLAIRGHATARAVEPSLVRRQLRKNLTQFLTNLVSLNQGAGND